MIRSMSGYGRGEAQDDGVHVAFEVRSVNHRFCRVHMRLPSELAFYEEPARHRVQEAIRRGKVDVNATVTGLAGEEASRVDGELAAAYLRQLTELAERLGIPAEIDLGTLATLPGVVGGQAGLVLDPERHAAVAADALDGALERLDRMRVDEGERLADDLRARFRSMRDVVGELDAAAGELPDRYREQLTERINVLMEEQPGEVDEARIAQEVVHYADRSDVTEEIVRLDSHLQKGIELLSEDGSVGRSLEFLVQEIHREVNTVGSKAKALDVADRVVDLKGEIEKIREQVQNLE